MQKKDKVILIGYSGHGLVVADALLSNETKIFGYCDHEEKKQNPFQIRYLGKEDSSENQKYLKNQTYVIGVGDNNIRERIYQKLLNAGLDKFKTVIHKTAILPIINVEIGKGTLVCAGSIINPLAKIGIGVICNTGSVIEHECIIDDFAHIAPRATLAGNVRVGKRSFIGANSVVKQGITIGNDVTVGAGSVIIKDIPDGETVVGNPARLLRKS